MKEKPRKYRRIKKEVEIIFKTLTDCDEKKFNTTDIGAGGICVHLQKELKPDTMVEIGLKLPGENKFYYIFAKVAWQSKMIKKDKFAKAYYNTGIRFLRMDLEERKKLINFIYAHFINKAFLIRKRYGR